MKKADNFNPGKWLVENKITFQSQLNENKNIDDLVGEIEDLDDVIGIELGDEGDDIFTVEGSISIKNKVKNILKNSEYMIDEKSVEKLPYTDDETGRKKTIMSFNIIKK
jgi:hypothetical protein